MSEPEPLRDAEVRARRGRNIVLAVALMAFVVLVFVVTMIRLSEGAHGH